MNRAVALLFFIVGALSSQDFYYNFSEGKSYSIAIRSNYRTYKNKKYAGLTSKEYKVIFHTNNLENNYKIDGRIYKMEKTLRNQVLSGYLVDEDCTVSYFMNRSGEVKSVKETEFPFLRGAPNFPEKTLSIGDSFFGYGTAVVDIENKYVLPIASQTVYLGKKMLFGSEMDYFEMRYSYTKNHDIKEISKTIAMHNVKLYYDNEAKLPSYIEDHFKEEIYHSGDVYKMEGFTLYFYNISDSMNKDEVLRDLSDDLDFGDDDGVLVEKGDDGVVLRLEDLKFKPNTTDLLDIEYDKLDKIYNSLAKIKDKTFLVEGHTALAGTEKEQYELSLERAKTIAYYLISKGLDSKRVLYRGKGADYPIAPNDTEENMRKNRRVEITILDG